MAAVSFQRTNRALASARSASRMAVERADELPPAVPDYLSRLDAHGGGFYEQAR